MADEKKQDALATRELPEIATRRGITEPQWVTLRHSLFPGASPQSVAMVWDYCVARGLDPFKKPVHIVPMEVRVGDNKYEWRDVVMPGVYEHRITATRTGEYLGHSEAKFGPDKDCFGVSAPEWCEMTVYRWNKLAGQRVEFPVRIYFKEVVATKRDRDTKEFRANARWSRAPIQMMVKCAEAAGLREAFPEEIGGQTTEEEMHDQRAIDIAPVASEVVQSPGIVAFEKLAEPLRDKIEQAFAGLKFSPAKRLTTLNEFLGGRDVDMETAPGALLMWCEEKAKAPVKAAKVENGKKPAQVVDAEPVIQVEKPVVTAPAQPVVDGELGF